MQPYPTFKILTQPTAEPVELADFLTHERIDGTDEQPRIAGILIAARRMVEEDSGLQLMTAVWRGFLDAFPYISDLSRDYRSYDATYAYRPIVLPKGPLQSFDSLQFVDTAGVTQTWPSANYRADTVRTPARVTPEFGIAWPVNRMVTNAVILQFTAGYPDAGSVPALAKQAIFLLAGHWYRNPEALGTVGTEIELGYRSLIHTLHWMEFDE